MSENNGLKLTPVDALVNDDFIQTIKACIPFLNLKEQSLLLTYTKLLEFQRSMHLVSKESQELKACSMEPAMRTPVNMLNCIRLYCSESRRKAIDNVLNGLQMYQMFQSLQQMGSGYTESYLESLLSEEQREMFRQFSESIQQENMEKEDIYG